MLADLGLSVVRQVPVETLAGLVTGAYSLHGGVIRDAGGRIVAHLLTSGPAELLKAIVPGLDVLSSLVQNRQLASLTRDVAGLHQTMSTALAVSVAGTAMAGLGLVTSLAGFAILQRRMRLLEDRLRGLDEKIDQIIRLITGHHLSILKGAIDALRHAQSTVDSETRRGLLLAAKRDFTQSAHYYGDLLADAQKIDQVELVEDCFTLSFVGGSLAASELGMYDIAAVDFDDQYGRWKSLAQEHVRKHVVGEERHRLLSEQLVEDFPAGDLVKTLDFALGEEKGWVWIDELRRERKHVMSSGSRFPWSPKDEELPKADAIRLSTQLRAKDGVLQANASHLNFLATRKISTRQFADAAEQSRRDLDEPVICILHPDRAVA